MPRMTFRQSLSWFLPVVAFYFAFSIVLVLVSFLIGLLAIPEDSYLLSLSNPISVVVAPFARPLFDSTSSAGTMMILLLVLLLLLQVDEGFAARWRYRTSLCLVPLVSGLVASALYLIPMRLSGLARDGSGSSIIVAGLNGMLLIVSVTAFNKAYTQRRYIDSAFSLVLLLTFVLTFRIGFLGAGNASAHFYGFLAGLAIVSAYQYTSSRRTHETKTAQSPVKEKIQPTYLESRTSRLYD